MITHDIKYLAALVVYGVTSSLIVLTIKPYECKLCHAKFRSPIRNVELRLIRVSGRCPRCGAEIRDPTARYCWNCGLRLA